MANHVKDAIMASFIADALSLGVHWVYDIASIKAKYGWIEEMVEPELAPYHKGKEKGAFTHYGDQALILLESVVDQKGFNPEHFRKAWSELFDSYSGYMDGATKDTLKNLVSNPEMDIPGSMSTDLGGAARIAPLSLIYHNDPDRFIKAAKDQTALTHNQNAVIQSAEFFSSVAVLVIAGEQPVAAIEQTLEKLPETSAISELIRAGLDSKNKPTDKAISMFGQMCSIQGALPSTIHLIAAYESDLKKALVENIMAGGDSSARGLLVGFILGAHLGLEQIPEQWLKDMKATSKIRQLMV